MRIFFVGFILALSLASAGCSHQMVAVCNGMDIGAAAVGPAALVGGAVSMACGVNSILLLGESVINLSRSSSGDYGESPYKTFRASQKVNTDITAREDIFQFVLDSQDRYKAGDHGSVTPAEKAQAVGRYASAKTGKTVVIIDTEKAWIVMYDTEVKPEDLLAKKTVLKPGEVVKTEDAKK